MRMNNLLKVLVTLLAGALATGPLAVRADQGIKWSSASASTA